MRLNGCVGGYSNIAAIPVKQQAETNVVVIRKKQGSSQYICDLEINQACIFGAAVAHQCPVGISRLVVAILSSGCSRQRYIIQDVFFAFAHQITF